MCVEENTIQNYSVWLWFSVNITVQLPQVVHFWSSEMSDSNVILTPEVWGTLYLHFLFQKSKKTQSQTWICVKPGGWIQKGQRENGQFTLLFPHSICLGRCCFTSLQARRPPLRYVMEGAINNWSCTADDDYDTKPKCEKLHPKEMIRRTHIQKYVWGCFVTVIV